MMEEIPFGFQGKIYDPTKTDRNGGLCPGLKTEGIKRAKSIHSQKPTDETKLLIKRCGGRGHGGA